MTIGSISKKLYRFGEENSSIPSPKALSQAVLSIKGIHIDETSITTQKNITVDLGGMGKGYGVDHVADYLQEQNIKAALLPALDFMRLDRNNEPDNFYIKQSLFRLIDSQPTADIYITQGFISLDADGAITNLQRGGSDYTATIIGAAIEADEVQIWTDIDGFHNNDPRYVNDTKALSHLSYDEAAELAYFGAKIFGSEDENTGWGETLSKFRISAKKDI